MAPAGTQVGFVLLPVVVALALTCNAITPDDVVPESTSLIQDESDLDTQTTEVCLLLRPWP